MRLRADRFPQDADPVLQETGIAGGDWEDDALTADDVRLLAEELHRLQMWDDLEEVWETWDDLATD